MEPNFKCVNCEEECGDEERCVMGDGSWWCGLCFRRKFEDVDD